MQQNFQNEHDRKLLKIWRTRKIEPILNDLKFYIKCKYLKMISSNGLESKIYKELFIQLASLQTDKRFGRRFTEDYIQMNNKHMEKSVHHLSSREKN